MSYKTAKQIRNTLSNEMYAFYLRKSRADLEMEALGEGETLAKHLKILQTLAARNDIHPDQIVIYKEVVSGDSIYERPEMMKLLDHVHQRRYSAVFVVEVERLARGNTKDQGEVAEAFQASHTKIITPMKVYNPDDEFDQEYFEFGLFMSRREYKTIRRRLENGKKLSVQDGNYLLPQRVYGYDIVRPSKKDRTLKIREDEAKIVHMIFDWYTEDRRASSWIAKELTMMGIPTMKNKPEWHRSTILGMLTNPIYIGKVTWEGSQTTREYDQSAGRLVKVRKFDLEPIVYEGKHDGIISTEQFEKAQSFAMSSNNPSVPLDVELLNPLAGMIKCCECGRHLIANSFQCGKETRLLHARSIKCKKKSLPLAQVMEAFVEQLKVSISYFEIKSANNDDTVRERYEASLFAMEEELAMQEKLRNRLFRDYDDDVYTRDEFIERKKHYTRVIDELKRKIQKKRDNVPQPVDYEEKIHTINSMIDCMYDPELSVKAKNDFLSQFISHVTYDVIDYGHKKGGKPILEVYFK